MTQAHQTPDDRAQQSRVRPRQVGGGRARASGRDSAGKSNTRSDPLSGAALALVPALLGVGLMLWRERDPEGAPAHAWMFLVGVATALVCISAVWRARGDRQPPSRVGAYTLGEKIGEGGMGVVYEASHALLTRPAAVKLLHPTRASAEDLRRFEREVQLTSQLSHPNTIAVYDFGPTGDGGFYYAMEYLDGLDLQALVEREGPQRPARVAHLLAQVCGALAEAHGLGLIHRDIKPANVVVCTRGGVRDVVKVLDFGLICELGEGSGGLGVDAQTIVGTPLYLSPEALTQPHRMDGRSDLYAVGALGYFLLTGAPPFSGSSVLEVCAHHLHTAAVAPSERGPNEVPPELEALILSCLEKSMERRPASAAALRDALLPLAAEWSDEPASSGVPPTIARPELAPPAMRFCFAAAV